MSDDIKYMNITEFREAGYLQEANRLFFHPLGLALEIKIDDDGYESLGGIWDYRDDDEGMYYDLKNSKEKRINAFITKAKNIRKEMTEKAQKRREKLNFVTEPIPNYEEI